MNRRQEYMRALKKEATSVVTWAPNFDHWYNVNKANGTLPEEYRDMSGNDIIRAVGGTIWRRVSIVNALYDDSVKFEYTEESERVIERIKTPVGELRTVHQAAPDSSKAMFMVEHPVKNLDDVETLKYVIEARHYELRLDEYERQLEDVGEDGILLTCLPSVPYIHFAKVDVGYDNAFYLMYDHPEIIDALLVVYESKFLEAYEAAAQGPIELVSNGDNMDQLTCPPHYFERYAIPFYRKVREILHAGGKIAQGHWCGRLDQLIKLIPDCGLDVIEAMTPKPMTEVDMVEAMAVLEGIVAVQGGVPSVYMCDVGCTREELVSYVENLINRIGHCRGFILGMGDNVPSSADFARVKLVSDVVDAYNANRTAAA